MGALPNTPDLFVFPNGIFLNQGFYFVLSFGNPLRSTSQVLGERTDG
jgi:hypothetical protein